MRRALLIATALAVAICAPAGAAKKAYFRLDVEASQHVKWSDDSLTKGCSDSVLELHAKGTGDLEAKDHNDPWAVAQRPADPRRTTLLTYGETGDRDSPLFESQTVRFSAKEWRTVAFTDEQIEGDPEFREQTVSGD